jgi:hypothetical protein
MSITTSKALSTAQKDAVKSQAGKLMPLIPGKSEGVLMISIDDGKYMAFRGVVCDCAHVVVKLYKPSPLEAKREFTEAFLAALEDATGIAPGDVFLTFEEYENWGSGGTYR